MLRTSLYLGITGILVAAFTGGATNSLSAQDDANPYDALVDVRAGEGIFERHCSRCHGMRVRREIQSRTERSVSIGSVYATLDRLEQKGYVLASFGASGPDARGRARKYFRLTPDGAQAVLRNREAINRMTEGVAVREELDAI
jgi:hypothetical protein